MNPRDIVVVLCLLVALAAGVALMFDSGAQAAVSEDPGFAIDYTGPRAPTEEPGPEAVETTETEVLPFEPESTRRSLDPDAPPPTSGTIEGSVSMTTDLVGKVDIFHVRIAELINPNSLTKRKGYDRVHPKAFQVPETHTPRFRIENVPFSQYGYRVELLASGINGSSQIVSLTEQNPFETVRLSMTKPVTFTVRVRDQEHVPYADWLIQVRPVGNPPGRSMAQATTDNYGVAMFDSLVRGPYVVWHEGREIGELDVQPATFPRAGQPITVQSKVITVPKGFEQRIEIFDPAGFGVAGVELELYKTDTMKNLRFNAQTDHGGVHTFEHLLAGRYQLNVIAPGYQRRTRSITIADVDPAVLKLRLVPTR